MNLALNQSTIQGPPTIQRTPTNRDAQPTRQRNGRSFSPAATPEQSPSAVPDIREQPLMRTDQPRQYMDVVPARSRRSNSSNIVQNIVPTYNPNTPKQSKSDSTKPP